MIGKICIVCTYSAGVFLGTIKERNGKEVLLTNARRIWYWAQRRIDKGVPHCKRCERLLTLNAQVTGR